jgi:hypothetical protein
MDNGQWRNGASNPRQVKEKDKRYCWTARWATRHETQLRSEAEDTEEKQKDRGEDGRKRLEDAWKSDV